MAPLVSRRPRPVFQPGGAGCDGPFARVTGGRASGGCRFALDRGRSVSQEGPAEEGGALHPRSTVTNCQLPYLAQDASGEVSRWLR